MVTPAVLPVLCPAILVLLLIPQFLAATVDTILPNFVNFIGNVYLARLFDTLGRDQVVRRLAFGAYKRGLKDTFILKH